MGEFSGVEPLVGEVRGLRTFAVEEYGALLPLFADGPWQDGENLARCAPPGGAHRAQEPHAAPDPGCECGFYAYGTPQAAGGNGQLQHVRAVVACWGRVMAGTRGFRAEHARIEAIWLDASAPDWLLARVRARYPATAFYADAEEMLRRHPLSRLDCYDDSRAPRRHAEQWFCAVFLVALAVLGLLPESVLRSDVLLGTAWLVAVASFATVSVWVPLVSTAPGRSTVAVLAAEAFAWLLTPMLGIWGWGVRWFLAVVVGSALWERARARRARRFPISRGVGGRRFLAG